MQNQPKNMVFTKEQPAAHLWARYSNLYISREESLQSGFREIHYHDLLEVVYNISGNGVYYIRDEIYPMVNGDIAIIYPGDPHDAREPHQPGSSSRVLFIDIPTLFRDWPQRERLEELTCAGRYRSRICSREENRRLLPYLQRILELYDGGGLSDEPQREDIPVLTPESREHMKLLIAGMLYETVPFLTEVPRNVFTVTDTTAVQQHRIYPAISYMLLHYAEPVRLEDLCQCCFLSPSHLRRHFAAVFGLSPTEFLHKIRIHHAAALLASSSQSILSIAVQCGYPSITSFHRQFEKIMHILPSEYRRMYSLS